MKKYYDPEYDREISEEEIRKQYDWFVKNQGMKKSYETFLKENFDEISESNTPFLPFYENEN